MCTPTAPAPSGCAACSRKPGAPGVKPSQSPTGCAGLDLERIDSALCILEHTSGQTRLANDRLQRPPTQLRVKWHRHGYGRSLGAFLHDRVRAMSAYLGEAVIGQDRADGSPAKNAQPTQPRPRAE
jgi:hypothetical protein